jgi:hypothetical protein
MDMSFDSLIRVLSGLGFVHDINMATGRFWVSSPKRAWMSNWKGREIEVELDWDAIQRDHQRLLSSGRLADPASGGPLGLKRGATAQFLMPPTSKSAASRRRAVGEERAGKHLGSLVFGMSWSTPGNRSFLNYVDVMWKHMK